MNSLHIVLYLSYDCNLRCSYCVLSFEKKIIGANYIHNLILFIEENNSKFEKIYLEFIWGEPLMHTDIIVDVMKQISVNNIIYQITTNGLYINDEIYKEIITKMNKVHLSYNENYFNKELVFSKVSKHILNKQNININFIYDPKRPLKEIKRNFLYVIKNWYQNIYILPIVLVHYYTKKDFIKLLRFIIFSLKFRGNVGVHFIYYLQEKQNHFEFSIDPSGNILGDNMWTAETFFWTQKQMNQSIWKIGNLSCDEIQSKLKTYSYRNYLKNMTIHWNTQQDFENLEYLSNILKQYDKQN